MKQRLSRCALVMGLVCTLAGGCQNSAQKVAPEKDRSGIYGYARQNTISARWNPSVDKFTLIIKDAKGKTSIKEIRTHGDGKFTVLLAPGHYKITPVLPHREIDTSLSRSITVSKGCQTNFTFNFDFGSS